MQTDLPDPVAPAISRCGIRAMSQRIGVPWMSRPRAAVSGAFDRTYSGDSRMLRSKTALVSLLGISMPIADLPGIGASIRTPIAARLRAISSARLTIRLTLTPGPGVSSNRVMVAPAV